MLKILFYTLLFCSSIFSKNNEQKNNYTKLFQKTHFKTSDGTKVNLSEIKQKVVIVNFWASWCFPCLAEFKSMNQLIKDNPKDVFIVGVNNDDEKIKKTIEKIESKHHLLFKSAIDKDVNLTQKFHVSRIPTSLIFVNQKFVKKIPEEYNFQSKEFRKLTGLK